MRHPIPLSLIAVSLLIPLISTAAGLSMMIDGQKRVFLDVPENTWFATYVKQAAEAGVVNGYMDIEGNLTGFFGPDDDVTVAQALKVVIESAGIDETKYGFIQSGVGNHWAALYVSAAKAEDFPTFATRAGNLDRSATRAEVSSLFTAAFGIDVDLPIAEDRYTDIDASTEFGPSVDALSRAGVVSGDTDEKGNVTGTFRPTFPIDRSETVKIAVESRARLGTRAGRTVSYREPNGRREDAPSFSPSILRVKSGTRVWFRNDRVDSPMWVASDSHPIHDDYPGFDAGRAYNLAEIYSFVFTRIGTWGYHDHLDPRATGTVIVE